MKSKYILGAVLGAALFAGASMVFAQTPTFNRQLGLGMSGSDVLALQTFLATNPDIYPAGKVTGYFGPLTAAAVTQFQANYGIPQVGRVGPMTLQKLNALKSAGLGLDISAPIFSSVAVQPYATSATVSWTTNESAAGKVYYSTNPLSVIEAELPFTAPNISGNVTATASTNTSGQVTVAGLSPNTTYFYTVVSTDMSGNVSMTWPSSFHTTQ